MLVATACAMMMAITPRAVRGGSSQDPGGVRSRREGISRAGGSRGDAPSALSPDDQATAARRLEPHARAARAPRTRGARVCIRVRQTIARFRAFAAASASCSSSMAFPFPLPSRQG